MARQKVIEFDDPSYLYRLAEEDAAHITGFAKLALTRRYELIDELYAEQYNEKYPAGKPLN